MTGTDTSSEAKSSSLDPPSSAPKWLTRCSSVRGLGLDGKRSQREYRMPGVQEDGVLSLRVAARLPVCQVVS